MDKVPVIGPYVEVIKILAMKMIRFFPISLTLNQGFLEAFRIRSAFYDRYDSDNLNQISYFKTNSSNALNFIRLNLFFTANLIADKTMGFRDDIYPENFVNYVIFVLYVFLLTMLIYNIIISIAIESLKDVLENSEVRTIKRKIDYILHVEDSLSI